MSSDLPGVIDHLFRHHAGQMVATLTRILGPANLSLAEEVVQDALISALQHWSFNGVPDNPTAWLFRVAKNKALDQLRRESNLREKEPELVRLFTTRAPDDAPAFAHELRDDQLRMMLLCCHPAIPRDSRIALTLKTVGGFGVDEIARAFLTKRETIAQRLVRAKRLIRDEQLPIDFPPRHELAPRLESLLEVLYLLFNEGYSAHAGDALVRLDVCAEAIRLTRQLVEHPVATSPAAQALLALMLLQSARLPARVDAAGELATLAAQDRSLWDWTLVAQGMRALDASAYGDVVTAYHVEAEIAACHVMARSFEETDWPVIIEHYDELAMLKPTPVVLLNRAIAIAMARGPAAGIAEIEAIAPSLRDYLPLSTTLGELWLRAGNPAEAARHFARALELPSTLTEKRFLLRKLAECG
ncbi:MAG TPA: sigma-70 family RNA polymerase sigma factor [Thermoanaerobaculia bacterium]